MLTEIEQRFRAGSITRSDCDALKALIVATRDESTLESAIYIYGRSCGFDEDVFRVCARYLVEHPVPGLTAVCMRTALDYWSRWEQFPEVLARYLNIDLYDEWYDEVHFACRFCARLQSELATTIFAPRLVTLFNAARKKGKQDLLALADLEQLSHSRDEHSH